MACVLKYSWSTNGIKEKTYQTSSQKAKVEEMKRDEASWSLSPVLEQDSLDRVVRVAVLCGPAGLHLHEDIWRKGVVGLQAHLKEEVVVAPQPDDSVVGVAERHIGVERHQQLQRGVELHHWEGLQPAGTTSVLINWSRLSQLKKPVKSCKVENKRSVSHLSIPTLTWVLRT